MFIVWKKRGRQQREYYRPEPLLIAYATTNRREGGKIRRTTRYIASLDSSRVDSASARAAFWHRADTALRQLDVTPDVRAKLEAGIARRVPRPSGAELKAETERWERRRTEFERDRANLFASLHLSPGSR